MTYQATTQDVFLKGRLTIEQPKDGFRSGSDAVLLAAAAAGYGFCHALDAGCGAGAALLSLRALVGGADKRLMGMEKDALIAGMAQSNVAANGFGQCIEIVQGDVLDPALGLHHKFDLVISNPPFFDNGAAIRHPAPGRQTAHVLGAPLQDWIKGLLTMTSPKGRVLLIHRADRLPDILDGFRGKAGDIGIFPIRPRDGEAAKRVLVSAQKGSRSPLRLLAGMSMHPSCGEGRFSVAYEAVCNGGILVV
jgi:tRNA1(Val) A37 N6-methylase TrmN6